MAEFKTPVKVNRVVEEIDKINIPPSPFLNRLGYGTGVSVMQLVRSPEAGKIRSPWALKMLNKRVKPNIVYTERLQAEADLLQRMSHPNIVGFRAFGKTKILYLGMEACDLSLGDMIEKKYDDDFKPFAPKYILKVASDIGNALDYLHKTMQILHGDIKSYNILVNGDFAVCKLCDFGVTLPLDKNGDLAKEKAGKSVYYGGIKYVPDHFISAMLYEITWDVIIPGKVHQFFLWLLSTYFRSTEAWSAPEVIFGDTISSKSDIWPLGLVFWEMLALMTPHSQLEDSLDISLDSLDDEQQSMCDYFSSRYGTRPAVPANICSVAYEQPLALFCCCTQMLPEQRPAARDLALAAAAALSSDKSALQVQA